MQSNGDHPKSEALSNLAFQLVVINGKVAKAKENKDPYTERKYAFQKKATLVGLNRAAEALGLANIY
jgi:hypothetical protein